MTAQPFVATFARARRDLTSRGQSGHKRNPQYSSGEIAAHGAGQQPGRPGSEAVHRG